MKYSPKLKNAMAEIKAILEKHDIAGAIVLHEPGFGEHLIRLDPSYSSAKLLNALKSKNYKPDFKTYTEGIKKIESTVNMFRIMAELSGKTTLHLMDWSDNLEGVYKPTHFNGGYTTHQEQNN